jgi:hypothetical protein
MWLVNGGLCEAFTLTSLADPSLRSFAPLFIHSSNYFVQHLLSCCTLLYPAVRYSSKLLPPLPFSACYTALRRSSLPPVPWSRRCKLVSQTDSHVCHHLSSPTCTDYLYMQDHGVTTNAVARVPKHNLPPLSS